MSADRTVPLRENAAQNQGSPDRNGGRDGDNEDVGLRIPLGTVITLCLAIAAGAGWLSSLVGWSETRDQARDNAERILFVREVQIELSTKLTEYIRTQDVIVQKLDRLLDASR